jgi:hypothetical protein
MTAITGNTYPVKDQLKAIGARWNPDQKAWMIADEKAAEARKIVSGSSSTSSRATTCKHCRMKADRYNAITRSGLCQSCLRDLNEPRNEW